jgi:hypothetical protein
MFKELHDPDILSRLMYLERNVNSGSPSGYTFKNQTSDATSPFGNNSTFSLPYVEVDKHSVVQVGTLPTILSMDSSCEKIRLPVHPDFYELTCDLLGDQLKGAGTIGLCEPTSSGRTVLVRDNSSPSNSIFIKLHYPGKLGRFERGMWLHNWIGSLEVSSELDRHSKSFPRALAFLPELGGCFIANVDNGRPWGVVFRSVQPKPDINLLSCQISLIPCFSLIAKPPGCSSYILASYLDGDFNLDFFIERFIDPILRSYTYLALELGLIPEINAQNLLFEISEGDIMARVVLRDMNDIWKDFTVRSSKGMHNSFSKYHSIDLVSDLDYFQKRSFSYDFKLSIYVLLPLCRVFCSLARIPFEFVRGKVRDLARQHWGDTKLYFGEDDLWFSYPNLENVGRTSYLEHKEPLFR